jgi:ABC-type Na+ efflux pump permease subunit
MQPLKIRKNAKNSAVALVLSGISIVLGCVFFYLKIKQFEITLAHTTKDQHAQSIILDLIGMIETVVTIIVPLCGILMIATGYYMLLFFRKEREELESKSGRS